MRTTFDLNCILMILLPIQIALDSYQFHMWKYNNLSLTNTFCNLGRVYRAKGLVAADMGGTSDPYCVLELDNARVR